MIRFGDRFPTHRTVLACLAAAVLGLPAAAGKTYYVDNTAGSDAKNGLSEGAAWKTLDKVNAASFAPGDRILFNAGSRFSGQLRPRGAGSEASPIIVDTYGKGDKPLIAAEGRFHEALLLENQDYWEVSNLQFTNTGPAREPFRYGIRVRSWDHGVMRHIHLKNLLVHDVNGSLVKKDAGEGHGIVWENGGQKTKSRFDDLLIEGCRLVRTDRNGICGYTPYKPRDFEARSTSVIIRGNLLEDIGGDGIKVWGAKGALVEHNILRGARTRCDDYAAGIWPWDSDDTLIQYNEVSGVKGTKDGEAFDSDAYTTNSTFQYNYTHDNDGGFMLICCYANTGTVVRYNISQNDRARLFHMAGENENISIYNNVFFTPKDSDVQIFLWSPNGAKWTHDAHIFNNIFYTAGTMSNSIGLKRKRLGDGTFLAESGAGGSRNIVFERNVLYGTFDDSIPGAWRTMVLDPMLESPGSGGNGLDSLEGYKLKRDSPLSGAGIPAKSSPAQDFWGNRIPEGKDPSIGAHEAQAAR